MRPVKPVESCGGICKMLREERCLPCHGPCNLCKLGKVCTGPVRGVKGGNGNIDGYIYKGTCRRGYLLYSSYERKFFFICNVLIFFCFFWPTLLLNIIIASQLGEPCGLFGTLRFYGSCATGLECKMGKRGTRTCFPERGKIYLIFFVIS